MICIKSFIALDRVDKQIVKEPTPFKWDLYNDSIYRFILFQCFRTDGSNGSEQYMSTQIRHLDNMCRTIERQIDVLSNVDQALPVTGKNYKSK